MSALNVAPAGCFKRSRIRADLVACFGGALNERFRAFLAPAFVAFRRTAVEGPWRAFRCCFVTDLPIEMLASFHFIWTGTDSPFLRHSSLLSFDKSREIFHSVGTRSFTKLMFFHKTARKTDDLFCVQRVQFVMTDGIQKNGAFSLDFGRHRP
jgi:hypothetical protein